MGKPQDRADHLLNVEAQYAADLCERAVHATGEGRHSGRGRESNQRDDQDILNQTLTRFIFMEANQCTPN